MNILVAVDGSECSDRAVQYVGSVLKDVAGVKLTLFHVLKAFPPELLEHGGSENPVIEAQLGAQLRKEQEAWHKKQIELNGDVLTTARDILTQAGVDTSRVSLKFGHEEDVARNILEEARDGGHGTVVVGRHGASQMKRLFGGGVTDEVLRHAKGVTIWVVE